ncbi:MAG: site-specific integrase [Bacteroidota bacterium]
MGFTTKLLLNKARQKNDGTYPLILRIIYARKVAKIPLGYCLTEKDWDEKNQRVRTSSQVSANITRLNTILKQKCSSLYDQVAQLDMTGDLAGLSIKELKDKLKDQTQTNKIPVYVFIDKLMAEKQAIGKKGTALTYRGAKRKLFSVFGDRLTTFEQIDYQALKHIETEHLKNGGGYGGLSVSLRALRAIYNRAIKENIVSAEHYPFKHYTIKQGETKRRALSEGDFQRLKCMDFPPLLAKARDFFLISFYLRGMNYVDMAYLQIQNIEGDLERISYQRNKTGKYFSIKVSEPLKQLLLPYLDAIGYKTDVTHQSTTTKTVERKKTKHTPSNDKKETYIFPILKPNMSADRQHETLKNKRKRLNDKLRKIADIYDFERFTIYAARHTYATMGKRKGVPTAVIQESLGHQTEAITQTYLDSFSNSVVDEYDALIMEG